MKKRETGMVVQQLVGKLMDVAESFRRKGNVGTQEVAAIIETTRDFQDIADSKPQEGTVRKQIALGNTLIENLVHDCHFRYCYVQAAYNDLSNPKLRNPNFFNVLDREQRVILSNMPPFPELTLHFNPLQPGRVFISDVVMCKHAGEVVFLNKENIRSFYLPGRDGNPSLLASLHKKQFSPENIQHIESIASFREHVARIQSPYTIFYSQFFDANDNLEVGYVEKAKQPEGAWAHQVGSLKRKYDAVKSDRSDKLTIGERALAVVPKISMSR